MIIDDVDLIRDSLIRDLIIDLAFSKEKKKIIKRLKVVRSNIWAEYKIL